MNVPTHPETKHRERLTERIGIVALLALGVCLGLVVWTAMKFLIEQ